MPRCSIIIPVYNRVDLTRQCLHALQDYPSNRVSYEIIVADDGSTDATPQFLADYGDRIRVVTLPTNSGYATACNAGAATATGEYLIFLNNDTLPQVGWLEALVDYAETHQKAEIVGSKLLFPDGTVQHAGCVIRRNRHPLHIYNGFPKDHPAVNKSRRFQMVTAACMLIRRERFKQVGEFDTIFLNGYEDVDLCLRVGERGGEVHYCHRSVVWHLEGATREDQTLATDEYRLAEAIRNTELYFARWALHVQHDDINYYLKDGLVMLVFREVYDHLRETTRSTMWLLRTQLRAFVYSEDTLPLWFSIPRGGMAVMLFFVQILRDRKKDTQKRTRCGDSTITLPVCQEIGPMGQSMTKS